jgi:hypothetical protein
MYRIRATGQVASQGEIRGMYPNTSFPSQWTPALVEELGLDPVFETPAPTTTIYQTAYKDGVEQVDGKWVWRWSIGPVFTDNEDGTAAEQEAAYKARIDAEAAKNVRSTRDSKLAECDWLVIKSVETGVALAADWAAYRQALRDVPAQANFPHTITWPEKP